jgi:hypothetical protein
MYQTYLLWTWKWICVSTWWIVCFIWVVHELCWLHMLLEVSKTNTNKPLDILHTSNISKVELKMPVFSCLFLWLPPFSYMSLFRTSIGPLIESSIFYLLSEFPLYSFSWHTHIVCVRYLSNIFFWNNNFLTFMYIVSLLLSLPGSL